MAMWIKRKSYLEVTREGGGGEGEKKREKERRGGILVVATRIYTLGGKGGTESIKRRSQLLQKGFFLEAASTDQYRIHMRNYNIHSSEL